MRFHRDALEVAVAAFPMHGQYKLQNEGYRTRDGHLIEWFGRLLAGTGYVAVLSRPEPQALRIVRSARRAGPSAANTRPYDAWSLRVPHLRDRQQWWTTSLDSYRYPNVIGDEVPAVIWNPMVALSNIAERVLNGRRVVIFDLLDDWTVHYAFESIRDSVEAAYQKLFQRADRVFANSEGTVELANRYGRKDVTLVPNGVDPERFTQEQRVEGSTTIGYVGKIGRRLDLNLIETVVRALPCCRFVFAGPILDPEYRPRLKALKNVELLGDVHYRDVPRLLSTFDVGWVPHNVGKLEIGGDVIKTYEYRAAGLPVLTTPIIGAGVRQLRSVYVESGDKHADWLAARIGVSERISREPAETPREATWESKARILLDAI
jgi:glycosyltransferase involved in cell wall biosynthesis